MLILGNKVWINLYVVTISNQFPYPLASLVYKCMAVSLLNGLNLPVFRSLGIEDWISNKCQPCQVEWTEEKHYHPSDADILPVDSADLWTHSLVSLGSYCYEASTTRDVLSQKSCHLLTSSGYCNCNKIKTVLVPDSNRSRINKGRWFKRTPNLCVPHELGCFLEWRWGIWRCSGSRWVRSKHMVLDRQGRCSKTRWKQPGIPVDSNVESRKRGFAHWPQPSSFRTLDSRHMPQVSCQWTPDLKNARVCLYTLTSNSDN